MRSLTLGCICLLTFSPSFSQQIRVLHNGAHIQLDGTLALERIGNNAYIVIKTIQPYMAIFDGTDQRRVHKIGVTLDGQWDSLKPLIGQKVSVSGKVQLEPTSPYYFNGTLIVAKSIRLANGSILSALASQDVELPANLTQFRSLVTFAPAARERFTYKTWDKNGTLLPESGSYLSCRLNGPGDVLNCYCPSGFTFTATGTLSNGHFTRPMPPTEGFDFAQFVIADPVRRSVSEAVECTRQTYH